MREMFSWSKLAEEFRVLEIRPWSGNEMIDLGRRDAGDFILDLADAARPDRELALAAEREHSAVALDFDFLRQSGHSDDRVIGLW